MTKAIPGNLGRSPELASSQSSFLSGLLVSEAGEYRVSELARTYLYRRNYCPHSELPLIAWVRFVRPSPPAIYTRCISMPPLLARSPSCGSPVQSLPLHYTESGLSLRSDPTSRAASRLPSAATVSPAPEPSSAHRLPPASNETDRRRGGSLCELWTRDR